MITAVSVDNFYDAVFVLKDFDHHKGKSEYEDVLQCGNRPSTMTDRGHQAPAAFLILASGLDKVCLLVSHHSQVASMQQVSIVSWQEAASPSCHPSWWQMHSFTVCAEQAHLPMPGMYCTYRITTGRHMSPPSSAPFPYWIWTHI